MNDDFYLDKENENNVGEDNSPEYSFNSVQSGEKEIKPEPENVSEQFENVENQPTFSTEQNSFNSAQNGGFNQPFQPNCYSYQQTYQPYYENSDDLKLYYEKKAVKKTANHIGLGLLLFYVILYAFSSVLGFLALNKEVYNFVKSPCCKSRIA